MEYAFRTLTSKDIFPMLNLINKIGINEIKNCFENEKISAEIATMKDRSDDSLNSLGLTIMFEIANVIIANLPKCQNELYDILASVSEMDRSDIENMGMADFLEMIIAFVKKEEFQDFFSVVSKLFK